ncbi:glycosyltransferase [Mesorhizobium sp. M1E.F.Ca.ET.045.02.1.1]|uniref:glycosyltransferase n=1 Tax=Mesorhizobium sp. M1E.F.Ca.ET.045.02.1.1 TaxID=2493672 RepID=UPI000F75B5B2|nr:glycosyltransferase [Mesorhizobium sp. M1E.F.Ca.ET.045.02.1.1]AZO25010.1 glycosyltransferase [Mesorhizobium sp. M1E.F.Ca.ET.045.02.1.1]TKB17566.1 MAG: glycosyltransferase [Mesorhizobium sp.]
MNYAPTKASAIVPSTAITKKRRQGVLFVIGQLNLGGTESQLVLLARELARRGWRVEVFSLTRAGDVLAEPLSRAGIPVFYGRHQPKASTGVAKTSPGLRELIVLLTAAMWLFTRVASTRPSVVHGFLPLTNFLSAIAGRIALAPFIVTSRRGLGNHQERWPWLKWMDRFANRFSHVVVANSHAVAADTAARDNYDVNRIKVIANALDLSRFDNIGDLRDETRRRLGLGADEVAIVIVANLLPYKGHGDLIEAIALASKVRPNIKLFMAGQDRGIGSALAQKADRLGIGAKVEAIGVQSDIPALLAGMDIGVIASHEEGFCNALMEKLAAGLPVVVTDVGGNPEAVSGLPGCVLVQPRTPADLARGLLAVVDGLPGRKTERELRQRTMRQRYSIEAMVDAYETLYLSGN